ncbi:MAG TPA: ferrous iron transport protein B [Pyrinomonadaceae bacterium]|nr:ferrous iron transport protein B [Pyrinomonadaceae bacterium]
MKPAKPIESSNSTIKIAVAGNPNAGKTTLFNAITGLKQKVANYPGVTVEKKSAFLRFEDQLIELIDLPGLYSLDATSIDEQIARDVILGKLESERPDSIIAVVDATNLERNLYLVQQLLEQNVPVVVALTMIDLFEDYGHQINIEKLSELLGTQVVCVNAIKNNGIREILESAVSAVNHKKAVAPSENGNGKLSLLPKSELTGQDESSDDRNQTATAKIFERYKKINQILNESVVHNDKSAHDRAEKIDRVLTHPIFGLIILFAVLLLVFQAIFSWAAFPMEILEGGIGALGESVKELLPPGMLTDLIADGIIAGVGGVIVFLPQILVLFLFISILEDSGYMARAAFLMDKLMSKVGLHGRAFLPLISSFACAIPGIMATRTIEDQRDRLATILIAPLMSCSARLPVYTLMIAAFFSGQYVFGVISLGALIMLAMYLLGITTAIIVAYVLKRTVLKAPPTPFVMELPPYRLPNLRTVFQNMLLRGWLFVKRAGTVILLISMILWALMYFPRLDENAAASLQNQTSQAGGELRDAAPADLSAETNEADLKALQLKNSFAGKLGHLIQPVIEPLGFDWKIGVSLIASFAAREVLVSTLSIIYNVGGEADASSPTLVSALREARRDDGSIVWTPLTAITLMVFFVLAMQCMSTVAVVRRETNSWKWTAFMVIYMTTLAYLAAFLTHQAGRFLGFS